MSLEMPALLGPSFPLPLDAPFTRADAVAAGVSDKRLHQLTRDGLLRRPIRRVYVAAQVPESLELRCSILGLVVPDGCFVCDRTAAWAYAGASALGPGEHLEVPLVSCFRPSGRRSLRNALTHSGERAVLRRDLCVVHGLLMTTPLRTALDLGRLSPTRDLRLAGMDRMLALGWFGRHELLSEIPRFVGERGVIGLRQLAPLVDGGAASYGESALRLRWYDAGLPRPRTQLPVLRPGREPFYLDLGLEELRFGSEYDGEEWHSGEEQQAADAVRRQWMRERGWQVEVFRRRHVFGRLQDAEPRLRAAFREARATLGSRTVIL